MSSLRTTCLAVRLAAGAALLFALLAGPASAATFPIAGSVTAGDPTRPSGLQSSAASTCVAPAAASGTIAGPLAYDAYQFLNSSGIAQCVTVSVAAASGADGVFISAYSSGTSFSASPLSTLGTSGDCLLGGDSFSFSAPPGGFILLVEECNPGEGATYSANVVADNISAAPGLAVEFRGFSVRATKTGALVRWRTASEVDVLGFNVFRQLKGHRVRVNSRLVPARGGNGGRAYAFLDRHSIKAARYWVQVVNLDGSREWFGPRRRAASAA